MSKVSFTARTLGFLILTLAFTSFAQAQATRTWVSGVGDDVNPCSRTAPCKTFAGAISKTAAGGEIDALDPGGFGAVTATKSITIDGTTGSGFGSILASAVNGVNVNDSATATPGTIVVNLRNLSINGAGTTLGINGVNFTSGARVTVENCIIFNFSNAGINVNFGATPNVSPELTVKNTTIRNITGDGVRATTTNGAQTAKVFVTDSTFIRNGNGVHTLAGGRAVVSGSSFNFHTGTGVFAEGGSEAFIDGNTMAANVNGLASSGAATNVKFCNNTVVRNTGSGVLLQLGGTGNSCVDNKITDNGTNINGVLGAQVNKS